MGDLDGLSDVLGGPDLAWLIERVRHRAAAGEGADGAPLSGRVRLASPTANQRLAVAKLIGAPKRQTDGLVVELTAVEQSLRRRLWPAGLVDAVVALGGPVEDRRAAAQAEADAWCVVAAALSPAIAGHPELAEWFDGYMTRGDLKRAARVEARRRLVSAPLATTATELVTDVATVLAHLPSNGELRSVFARRVVGDAHALDYTRPLTGMVLAAVRALDGVQLPPDAIQREVWESVGVFVSGLGSTAFCLGVAAVPNAAEVGGTTAATATYLDAARHVPIAVVLTLDQVQSDAVEPMVSAGTVFVCENTAIIEAAATALRETDVDTTVQHACVVCLAGQPTVAVAKLISRLASRGATVRYHGDFDWAGLRIASNLSSITPWTPWRFDAEAYELARQSARNVPSTVSLKGFPAESPWDPSLAQAMASCGQAVEEEAMIDHLVSDVVRRWQ